MDVTDPFHHREHGGSEEPHANVALAWGVHSFGQPGKSSHHIRIQHPILLQVMRNGVLRQQWCLQADFRSNPFAFRVGRTGCMIAHSAASEAVPEFGALDLVEMSKLTESLVANRSRNINLESHD
jgi:hypothetical protein